MDYLFSASTKHFFLQFCDMQTSSSYVNGWSQMERRYYYQTNLKKWKNVETNMKSSSSHIGSSQFFTPVKTKIRFNNKKIQLRLKTIQNQKSNQFLIVFLSPANIVIKDSTQWEIYVLYLGIYVYTHHSACDTTCGSENENALKFLLPNIYQRRWTVLWHCLPQEILRYVIV